jgi:hypothetical protein
MTRILQCILKTKTGITKKVGIPGTEKYYCEQHKLDGNKQRNFNVKRLNSKLPQNCLKIFVSCLILFVISFKYIL